jgi:hypothetical protein
MIAVRVGSAVGEVKSTLSSLTEAAPMIATAQKEG